MTDISLCLWRKTCPLAPLCYRATAEQGEWRQSWIAPGNPGDGCRDFMPERPVKENECQKRSRP